MSEHHECNKSKSAKHQFVSKSKSESSHSPGTSYIGRVKSIHINRGTKNSWNENKLKMKGQASQLCNLDQVSSTRHPCPKNNQNQPVNLTGFDIKAFKGEGDAFQKEKLGKDAQKPKPMRSSLSPKLLKSTKTLQK
jgi:hypothetical protein